MHTPHHTAICPALLVAAPASGHGKTTVVAALARLYTRQGRRVQVFKCGPDFLDPGWHQLASAHPVHNLDLWMTGVADIRQRLYEAATHNDLLLLEGVMGLFDGQPSAADMAALLGIPVLLVIDASKMAETFAAVAYGLRYWRRDLPWAGVLANRTASARHVQMLHQAMHADRPYQQTQEFDTPMQNSRQQPAQLMDAEPCDMACGFWGAMPAGSQFTLPERHLGLTAASEMTDAMQRLDAAADALAQTALGRMTVRDWARWNVHFDAEVDAPVAPWANALPPLAGRRIAVARDAAFQFIYQANADVLQQMGADLCWFSPLADAALPDCDALWLPGGYPELHASRLSRNTSMAESVRAHVQAGKPVWAECGGMMVLFEQLYDHSGHAWPMWGVLRGCTRMQRQLAGLGAQQLHVPVSDWGGYVQSVLDIPALRGHTFHYSVCETTQQVVACTSRPGQPVQPDQGEALYQGGVNGCVRASYFHPWFASSPLAAARLFMDW